MALEPRSIAEVGSIVGNYYTALMIERLKERAIIYRLADKRPMPKGTGNVINMNRFTNFPYAKTALGEQDVPTPTYLCGTAVTATLFQVGGYTAVSEMLELTSFTNVLKECSQNMGDAAAIGVDKWIMNKCLTTHATDTPLNMLNGDDVTLSTWFGGKQGGISSLFVSATGLWFTAYAGPLANYLSVAGNAHAGIGGGYAMDLDKLAMAAARLRGYDVQPYPDGYYKAVLGSKQVSQIMRTAEWASWNQYTRPEVLDKGEVGRAHGIRLYESNVIFNFHTDQISQYGNLCNYFAPIWGQGAFAVTEVTGKRGTEIIVKAPNKYDTSNPLNQWSSIGYKVTLAVAVLNPKSALFLMTLG